MSSREDASMQLPTWDDDGDELDYTEDDPSDANFRAGGPEMVDGDEEDPGDPANEPSSSNAMRPAMPIVPAPSASRRNIGPALPPGFGPIGGDEGDDDEIEDPEDPDDPGMDRVADPGEPEIGPALPSISAHSVAPSLPFDVLPSAGGGRPNGDRARRPSGPAADDQFDVPPAPTIRAAPPPRIVGPALPPGFDDYDASSSLDVPPEEPSFPGPSTSAAAALPVRRGRPHGAAAPSSSFAPPPPTPASAAIIGPAMPPDLLPFEANGAHGEDEESEEEAHAPNGRNNGRPQLVGGEDEEEEEEEEDDSSYGPALPPGLAAGGPSAGGPSPSNGRRGAVAAARTHHEMEMPGGASEDDDDDDVIGPMPAASGRDYAAEVAARKAAMDAAKAAEDKKLKREDWMLQPPKKLNNFGLGARTFSKASGAPKSDDSSAWTQNPNEGPAPETAEASKERLARMATAERDAAQAAAAAAMNVGRAESMLDSHSRKRKAENGEVASGSGVPGERRAFDREKDMHVRGLKSASTSEIKDKCGQLTSRFGNSSSQKFL